MTEQTENKSRTEIKKEAERLQKLGEALLKLTPGELNRLDIPDELKSAINDARSISSRQAGRRQRQFIGSLMRRIDPEPIEHALQLIRDGIRPATKKVSGTGIADDWYNRLMAGDNSVMETILSTSPEADRQRLRQLTRNAVKEKAGSGKKKAAKALRAYLSEISQQQ